MKSRHDLQDSSEKCFELPMNNFMIAATAKYTTLQGKAKETRAKKETTIVKAMTKTTYGAVKKCHMKICCKWYR